MLWGIVVGLLQAATPLVFWWLDTATVYALGLVAIAAIYVGFAVADGRPKVIAIESGVTFAFVVVAAAAITGSPWLLVAGLPATDSRTFGSIEPTSWPTRDGGRRSA
jgi:fucose 4-O-acetylase-like acetyltransferase